MSHSFRSLWRFLCKKGYFKEICLYSITDGERGSGVRARNRLRGQPRGTTAEKGSLERRCYKAFQVLLGAEADRYARPGDGMTAFRYLIDYTIK